MRAPILARLAHSKRRLAFASVFTCVAALSGSAHAEDAAACKALADAMIANLKTPYHSYATITFGYAPTVDEARRKMHLPLAQDSETIFTGQAAFFRLQPRKWQPLPGSLTQFQDSVRESVTGLTNCAHLPDDTVNGEKTSVYVGSSKPQNHSVQTKVWVSPKGVPARTETDIEIGDTPGGEIHQHISTRYEYGAIQAPPLD
jgi:hypothetical protein